MTTDHEMAMRVHVALGGTAADFPWPDRGHAIIARQRLVDIGRELDRATRRDVAAEVASAVEAWRQGEPCRKHGPWTHEHHCAACRRDVLAAQTMIDAVSK